jgi:hypothetical protein
MVATEERVSDTRATMPMPIVGEVIVIMNRTYRCVGVAYHDSDETKGMPEVRVRFKEIAPNAARK